MFHKNKCQEERERKKKRKTENREERADEAFDIIRELSRA